jgi:hypothetical protein
MKDKNKKLIKSTLVSAIILASCVCYASGSDILSGTADSLIATINGTGKTYIYLTEGILSVATYIRSKNLLLLSGIVVVSIFLDIMLTVAGVS